MYTLNLSLSDAHHFSVSLLAGQSDEVASMGFLSVVAFTVTIMLASFALEVVLGLVKSAFRLVRKVFLALTVVVLVGAVVAIATSAAIVSAQGS